MIDTLQKYPLVPVFFHADAGYAQKILQACYDGGMRLFEFTNRGPEAPEVFAQLSTYKQQHCPEMLLGIGTIYTVEDAELFIDTADFIVQPVTTEEVCNICKQHNKPWLPGATTPNEIYQAWRMGAAVVKVFPGSLVGPDFIKVIRGPMPHIPLMVNGGIEPDTAQLQTWFEAGVNALGIGTQLFKTGDSEDFSAIRTRVADLMAFVKTLQK